MSDITQPPSPERLSAPLAAAADLLDLPTPGEVAPALADPEPPAARCRRAIALYDGILGGEPDRVTARIARAYAYFLLGNALLAQERHTEALAAYLQVDDDPPPRDARWLRKKLHTLAHLRLHAELLDACNAELAVDPTDTDALHSAAHALHWLRRHAEALAVYERLLAQSTGAARARVLTNMGSVYYNWRGHDAEVLAAIDAALALDPADAAALHNRPLVLASMRRGADGG